MQAVKYTNIKRSVIDNLTRLRYFTDIFHNEHNNNIGRQADSVKELAYTLRRWFNT